MIMSGKACEDCGLPIMTCYRIWKTAQRIARRRGHRDERFTLAELRPRLEAKAWERIARREGKHQ